jgi:hypothetical protein
VCVCVLVVVVGGVVGKVQVTSEVLPPEGFRV